MPASMGPLAIPGGEAEHNIWDEMIVNPDAFLISADNEHLTITVGMSDDGEGNFHTQQYQVWFTNGGADFRRHNTAIDNTEENNVAP